MRVLAASLVLGLSSIVAVATPASDRATEDPWTDKSREEIVAQLGEPSKAKNSRDGSAALTFRFVRIGPEFIPDADTLIVEIPGVGLVARSTRPDDDRPDPSMSIAPSSINDDGVLIGGGPTSSTSRTISRDTQTGEVVDSAPPSGPTGKGRVKLKLSFGPDGRVESWAVSPRQK